MKIWDDSALDAGAVEAARVSMLSGDATEGGSGAAGGSGGGGAGGSRLGCGMSGIEGLLLLPPRHALRRWFLRRGARVR